MGMRWGAAVGDIVVRWGIGPLIVDNLGALPPEFRYLTWFRLYGTAVGLLALIAIMVAGIYFSPTSFFDVFLILLCLLSAIFVILTAYFRWLFLRRSAMRFTRDQGNPPFFTFSASAKNARNAESATIDGPGWVSPNQEFLALASFDNIWVIPNGKPRVWNIPWREVQDCESIHRRFAYDQLQVTLTTGAVITIALTAQSILSVRGASESEVVTAVEAIESSRRQSQR